MELGESGACLDQGEGEFPDLGTDILGGDTVVPDIQIIDVGNDTVHQEVVRSIPPQGGPRL